MARNITDILRKFPDYKSITYSTYLDCPNEDMRRLGDKPNLVGWCETNLGYMMVLECPHCFKLFRYHATEYQNATLEEFNTSLLKKVYRDHKFDRTIYFNNGREIYNKVCESNKNY